VTDWIGSKIREARKAMGLSIRELAEKVGISKMTLQRIEIGKTSPSVSVLAQIAQHLSKGIDHFILEKQTKILHVKNENQQIVESPSRTLKAIISADLTDKNILVNFVESKKGSFIHPHMEQGHALVYIFEGKSLFVHDGVEYPLNTGDTVYFDARFTHSVMTLSKKQKTLSIFFKE
jgi:transcriptional regulator with XRE-family HTH domain